MWFIPFKQNNGDDVFNMLRSFNEAKSHSFERDQLSSAFLQSKAIIAQNLEQKPSTMMPSSNKNVPVELSLTNQVEGLDSHRITFSDNTRRSKLSPLIQGTVILEVTFVSLSIGSSATT